MNLPKETAGSFNWLYHIIRAFICVKPGTTIAVIAASGIAMITRLLAFLLPLKVILLAGREGVPRYFQFFVHPDQKMEWIIGLTIAAFVFYAVTLILEALAARLAQEASGDVLQHAGDVRMLSNQTEEAQTYYAKFCELSANLLFAGVALLVLALLNLLLFSVLAALIIGQYLFSAWIVRGDDDLHPGRLKKYVFEKLNNYIKILSSINFLTAFLVILLPFVLTAGGNILIAIASIILTRRTLGSLEATIKEASKLSGDRHQIDPLVFKEFQLEEKEKEEVRSLREVFSKKVREDKVAEVFSNAFGTKTEVEVHWEDPRFKKISTFMVAACNSGGTENKYYQMQVFPAKKIHLLENEEFLFRQVPRQSLSAPKVASRFSWGSFECQICEYGQAKQIATREWMKALPGLLQQIWSCKPPRMLVDAFAASTPLLHKRLSREFIQRLDIALDTDEEKKVFGMFLEKLPKVEQGLLEMPLYIHNPDLNYKKVVPVKESSGYFVMSWGEWSLEPVGAHWPKSIKKDQIAVMLQEVSSLRQDIPSSLSTDHLLLASLCRELEQNINKCFYKKALGCMERILSNPLLAENREQGVAPAANWG